MNRKTYKYETPVTFEHAGTHGPFETHEEIMTYIRQRHADNKTISGDIHILNTEGRTVDRFVLN